MSRISMPLLIGLLTVGVLLAGGILTFSFFPGKPSVATSSAAKIELDHTSYNLEKIAYSGGPVTHRFSLKNSGTDDLKIYNLSTSCMCTKAALKTSAGQSPTFGMKGMSPVSSWVGTVKPGEEAEVLAIFDPAFHGPQGTGPFSRVVAFQTSDASRPYIELGFSGVVVK